MSEINKTQEEFLANFNWHNFQEGIDPVDEKNLQEFEELVTKTFIATDQEEVVEGVVVRITERDAIVDINAKSEGVISLNEFRYNPNLKVGDKVEVLIDVREDKTGQLVLSHRKARTIKAWDRVISANETGEIVNGFVKCRTKGGMIVDVFGIEAFLPGSQIDVKPIRDYDQYVNKTMEFKVVKINHEFKNVVVSHKALIEADIEVQKKEIIGQLEKGQVLEGRGPVPRWSLRRTRRRGWLPIRSRPVSANRHRGRGQFRQRWQAVSAMGRSSGILTRSWLGRQSRGW